MHIYISIRAGQQGPTGTLTAALKRVNWVHIYRIRRNHHSPEDSDGVSRHRLVPISPTFYISHFRMITGFRLRLN